MSHYSYSTGTGIVDISEKSDSKRVAIASGRIQLQSSTIEKIITRTTRKANVLESAETAAILAVKKTPYMLPLCHQVNIESVKVVFEVDEAEAVIKAEVTVKSTGKTGVEMDALHGLSVALLTIWDMVKVEEKDKTGNYPHTRIEAIQVDEKRKMDI